MVLLDWALAAVVAEAFCYRIHKILEELLTRIILHN